MNICVQIYDIGYMARLVWCSFNQKMSIRDDSFTYVREFVGLHSVSVLKCHVDWLRSMCKVFIVVFLDSAVLIIQTFLAVILSGNN